MNELKPINIYYL